jgi:hypothetical protein
MERVLPQVSSRTTEHCCAELIGGGQQRRGMDVVRSETTQRCDTTDRYSSGCDVLYPSPT